MEAFPPLTSPNRVAVEFLIVVSIVVVFVAIPVVFLLVLVFVVADVVDASAHLDASAIVDVVVIVVVVVLVRSGGKAGLLPTIVRHLFQTPLRTLPGSVSAVVGRVCGITFLPRHAFNMCPDASRI